MSWNPPGWNPPGWTPPGWFPGSAGEFVLEDVEVRAEGPAVTLQPIESVEVRAEGPAVSLLRLYIEIVECRIDNLDVMLVGGAFRSGLAADGREPQSQAA